MKELSLHILDIIQNSLKAKASLIQLIITDSVVNNLLKIEIVDNGIGMNKETISKVVDPFYTTRNTRKVGLGIPLLYEATKRCNGDLKIESELGRGTKLICSFERDNIDRAPLGNIGDTIMTIINSLDNCEFIYRHIVDKKEFEFSTIKIKEILDGTSINSPNILLWIKEYIEEAINELNNTN